jgi:hypothetical protein
VCVQRNDSQIVQRSPCGALSHATPQRNAHSGLNLRRHPRKIRHGRNGFPRAQIEVAGRAPWGRFKRAAPGYSSRAAGAGTFIQRKKT